MQELQAFVVKEYTPFTRVVVKKSEHFEIMFIAEEPWGLHGLSIAYLCENFDHSQHNHEGCIWPYGYGFCGLLTAYLCDNFVHSQLVCESSFLSIYLPEYLL